MDETFIVFALDANRRTFQCRVAFSSNVPAIFGAAQIFVVGKPLDPLVIPSDRDTDLATKGPASDNLSALVEGQSPFISWHWVHRHY